MRIGGSLKSLCGSGSDWPGLPGVGSTVPSNSGKGWSLTSNAKRVAAGSSWTDGQRKRSPRTARRTRWRYGAWGQAKRKWCSPPWTKTSIGFCSSAIVRQHDGLPSLRTVDEYLADWVGERLPAIRSGFDVYLVENRLVYVKEPCGQEDVDAPFFLHVAPVVPDDLPGPRRRHGFDNLDFRLNERVMRVGWTCPAGAPPGMRHRCDQDWSVCGRGGWPSQCLGGRDSLRVADGREGRRAVQLSLASTLASRAGTAER